MAWYAIGDVQGCRRCLERLLTHVDYQPGGDRLWLVGDLVNRGPDSLGSLRLVRELEAEFVLGNHDLHLLAVAAGGRPLKSSDTFTDVLDAPDRDELLDWLAAQPLLARDDVRGWAMVHAGLAPQWDLDTATGLARELEAELRRNYRDRAFMQSIYGDEPDRWDPELAGMERLRFLVNALTRMRFCDAGGRLDMDLSGPPGSQPAPLRPWFEYWKDSGHRLVFGHWSTLGASDHGRVISTDSGCVWGGRLTAVRLDVEPVRFASVSCDS